MMNISIIHSSSGVKQRLKWKKLFVVVICLMLVGTILTDFIFYDNTRKLVKTLQIGVSNNGSFESREAKLTTMLNVGLASPYLNNNYFIWPRNDYETDDRIANQISFMKALSQNSEVVKTRREKIIYHVPHPNYAPPPPEGQQLFHSCPIKNCRLTRNIRDYKNADAVMIESFGSSYLGWMLPKPKHQVWIASGGECPPLNEHMKLIDTRTLKNLVNWTMLYRTDSTISTPYGRFEKFENFTRIEDYEAKNYTKGKTKKVAWMASNCGYGLNSGRGNYARQLAKYIDVDMYGACGTMNCPKNDYAGCLQMLRRDYKFYLSFENNCCKQYITEKFFANALQNNVLPIVLGASPADYASVAPPGSYIHVDDYESPEHLARYLHVLDKNDTLYNEYFRWKKTGRFITNPGWCTVCALLHANDNLDYVHWYPDFHQWWEEGVCLKRPPEGQWQSWNWTGKYLRN